MVSVIASRALACFVAQLSELLFICTAVTFRGMRYFSGPTVSLWGSGAVDPSNFSAIQWRAHDTGSTATAPADGLSCCRPGYGVGSGLPPGLFLCCASPSGPLVRENRLFFSCKCVYALGRSVLQASLVPSLEYVGDKKKTLEKSPPCHPSSPKISS